MASGLMEAVLRLTRLAYLAECSAGLALSPTLLAGTPDNKSSALRPPNEPGIQCSPIPVNPPSPHPMVATT